ncbi:hypothetical protein PROFUN_10012 [Planoprotostelium fungivorum]|uniref:Protein kinase domain-containing protein n=1 Tax=Planoprotostelium fungivorum TaxID=1890364 RepID=A0A2P6NFQ7_9EUKA|nr:hypothetical protein PROFUN_10012 [Planoprotostelium fungivorum]
MFCARSPIKFWGNSNPPFEGSSPFVLQPINWPLSQKDQNEEMRLLLFAFLLYSSQASIELSVLSDLFASTNGWSGNDPCQFYGVCCVNGSVTELQLSNNNLFGSIPDDIGNLLNLTVFNVSLNPSLYGDLPMSMGRLGRLTHLDISSCFLSIGNDIYENMTELRLLNVSLNLVTTRFPSETVWTLQKLEYVDLRRVVDSDGYLSITPNIGNLSQLRYLDLSMNSAPPFSFPPEMAKLIRLEELYLYFFSTLSSSDIEIISDLSNLRRLVISGCNYNGYLPDSYSNLVSLEYFDFSQNSIRNLPDVFTPLVNLSVLIGSTNLLDGPIPPSLLDNPSIQYIDLSNTGVGSFSECNASSSNLQYLMAHSSRLTGSIPYSFRRLNKLKVLDVSNNHLSGSLEAVTGMDQLVSLMVSSNQFVQLPTSLPSTLIEFKGSNNAFNGSLPSSMFSEVNCLNTLLLDGNSISGSIPKEIYNLKQLKTLDLSQNLIRGTIPSSIGALNQITTLYLYTNLISGSIPPSIGNLSAIEDLNFKDNYYVGMDLSLNKLTGIIPQSIGNLSLLTTLTLGPNGFNGSSLDFLKYLPRLSYFHCSYCGLIGEIPSSISPVLQEFDVQKNNLQGALPSFPIVISLRVSYNNLTGQLPSQLGTFPLIWDLSHNQFTGHFRDEWTVYLTLNEIRLNDNLLTNEGSDNKMSIFMSGQYSITSSLRVLDVSNNLLSGGFGGRVLYGQFLTEGNDFSGQYPLITNVGSTLQIIDISNNQLEGDLASWFDVMSGVGVGSNIQLLNVSHNRVRNSFVAPLMKSAEWQISTVDGQTISGNDWWVTQSERNLRTCTDLSHNNFFGIIPQSIYYMSNLKHLLLQDNHWQEHVITLNLANNQLESNQLSLLSSLPNIQYLNLSGNLISTIIPFVPQSIRVLDLSNNNMYGPLPSTLFSARSLDIISLQNNQFSGSIQALDSDPTIFDVSSNQLTGEVTFIERMSNIKRLNLQNNQFTGELPSLFGRNSLELPDFNGLSSLMYVDLSHNQFTGTFVYLFDVSTNNISDAKQFSLPPTTGCHFDGNPLHCPISWNYISQCNSTCYVLGLNEPDTILYHMEGTVSNFDPAQFIHSISTFGNITADRLKIVDIKSGSVIATLEILPPSEGNTNQGSVADTKVVLLSKTIQDYATAGILLISPPGELNRNETITRIPTAEIAGGVAGAVILMSGLSIAGLLIYRNRLKIRMAKQQLSQIDMSKLNLDTVKKSVIGYGDLKSMAPVGIGLFYLSLRGLIQLGAYGVVYKAKWRGLRVAVKQIRAEFISQTQMEEFLREVSIIQNLKNHPNIVMFIGEIVENQLRLRWKGVTLPPEPLSLVTEYCEGGSLYHYLRKENIPLNIKFSFLNQIILGMFHLHSEKIHFRPNITKHRDLAVRNILLSAHNEAKVADFGLSREQTDSQTTSETKSTVGPVAWMSPEAILKQQYSTKSDVFSFGVVIWEIISEESPWANVKPVDVAFKVARDNQRLETPENCPDILSTVMNLCFKTLPEERPEFKKLADMLSLESSVVKRAIKDNSQNCYETPASNNAVPQHPAYPTIGSVIHEVGPNMDAVETNAVSVEMRQFGDVDQQPLFKPVQ